ncbi:hypothetical protein FIBSPDRAFT_267860 [Athelia psychrophila]|uniref:ZZ-type domain-containing protein n=1 Tax=Athelia psychrophila TaxID=1759441 RepID=A0A166RHL5_9AGAM|nr:hypothetical protein FIBSPDRAFT_267860 [Fibularhizoctonia sp. CBS 109695]
MAELRLFTRQWQQHLTVPVETFAGQDLCEVHNSSHEKITQNRQGLRSALTGTSMRDIRPVVEGVGAELAEEGETGDDDEAAVEEEPVGNPDEEAEDGEGEARESAEETLTDKPEAEGSEGEGEEVQEAPTGPTQTTYCDECGTGDNIVGSRWKCMVCQGYDLCDRCHSSGMHDQHRMLEIAHPADVVWIDGADFKDDLNVVLLGLRVYSTCPVDIQGQIANGYSVLYEKSGG